MEDPTRNYQLIVFRTSRTMTTWMYVWAWSVRPLGSVFWTAIMTVAAKLIVCRHSKINIQNALARFVELNKMSLIYNIGELPTWLPLRRLRLWLAWKESDIDTLFKKFFKTSSHPTKWLVFNNGFLNYFNLGGVTENFEFKINDDTEVYGSCSAVLNGEVLIFGGSNKSKQVNVKSLNFG